MTLGIKLDKNELPNFKIRQLIFFINKKVFIFLCSIFILRDCFVWKDVIYISLTIRQQKIAEMVKLQGPITGDAIAKQLNVTRAALRSDLAILIVSGILDARPKVGYFYSGRETSGFLTNDLKNMLVKDVQSLPVVMYEKQTAHDAVLTMFLEDIGSIFVINEEHHLCGVVSRKDLLRTGLNNRDDLKTIPLAVIMTPLSKMVITTPDEPIQIAIRKIIDNEIDGIPVVKQLDVKKFEVIGRLTKTNLTRLLLDLADKKGRYYNE